VLPAIEHFSYLGHDAERMLHGLLDHEAGHACDTDFEIVERLGNAIHPEGPEGPEDAVAKVRKGMLNAVEDGYVEGRRALIYKGCAHNFSRKNGWFWERPDPGAEGRTVRERIASAENPFSVIALAITTVVRAHGGRSIESIEDVNPAVGGLLRLVEPELAEVGTLYGQSMQTGRCLDITDRILAKLNEEAEKRGEEMTGGLAPPDGPPDGGPGKVPVAMAEADAHGAANPEEAVLIEIRLVLSKDDDQRPYMVFSHEYDVVEDWRTESPRPGYDREETHAAEAADVLTQTFEVGLRARRDKARVAGWDEGDVAPELLAEWSTGAIPSDEIYEQMIALDDRAVAVGILLDCSGSMAGNKSLLARRTAIAMHQALAACQITHEITGFATLYDRQVSSNDSMFGRHQWIPRARLPELHALFERARAHLSEAHARGVDVTQFARIVADDAWSPTAALCVPIYGVFKDFGSDDARNLLRVEGTTANLDGEAVMWQARRLAQRPEPRRVMFVLSDGLPSGSRSDAQGARYLRQSVERIVEAGIEVYGIGMCSPHVREYYPTSWVANSMDELTNVALTALVEALAENRQERSVVKL
jgi:hypothetical protein